MTEHGAQVPDLDRAVFYWRKEDSLHGPLAAHVDDYFGLAQLNLKLHSYVRLSHHSRLAVKKLSDLNAFGLDLEQSSECITLE